MRLQLIIASFALTLSISAASADNALRCRQALQAQNQDSPHQNLNENLLSLFLSLSKVDPTTLIKGGITANEVYDLGESPTHPDELALLLKFRDLSEDNKLTPLLEKVIDRAAALSESSATPGPFQNLTPEKKQLAVVTLSNVIQTTLSLRGMTPRHSAVRYVEWKELSQKMKTRLDQSAPGIDSILTFTHTQWIEAGQLELLVDGLASFVKRKTLFDGAKKSLHVLTWSIYDDLTGFQYADLLISKKQQGLDVRVVVDGQTAESVGHREAVARLEKAGVPVVRWRAPHMAFAGQHRKLLIVDGDHAITGGMNFGDVYSHLNPDPKVARWRDTDLYLNGTPVIEFEKLFAKLWNSALADGLSKGQPLVWPSSPEHGDRPIINSNERVAIINSQPDEKAAQGSTIMMTLLKLIRESRQSIDIENAYVILFPALREELIRAKQRGVQVRILTNSPESVDEPIVSVPILRTAMQLHADGMHVFLRKGSTLHSKIAVVDDRFAMVTSYNLHPRSERIEGEMAVLIDSVNFARQLREQFEIDISSNKAYDLAHPEKTFSLPNDLSVIAVLRIFFDLL